MYQRQVSFGEAISRALRQYCCFTGRSSRSEYWWFALFCYIISFAAFAIAICLNYSEFAIIAASSNSDMAADPEFTGAIISLYSIPAIASLLLFLPAFGLLFRRLHDAGHSGWWWLISFVPFIGGIVLLVFTLQGSVMEENKYGPIPNLAGGQYPPAYNG